MTQHANVVVIGGGQAGLAAGYHLRRKKLDFVILDAQRGLAAHLGLAAPVFPCGVLLAARPAHARPGG